MPILRFSTRKCATPNAPATLLLALSIATFLASLQAYACRCSFQEEEGFIHGSGHLPSNARGALFQVKRASWPIAHEGNFTIVDQMPTLLKATSFVIKRAGSDTEIPAVLEQVKFSSSDETENPQRTFYTGNHELQTCIRSRDAGTCKAVQVDITSKDWVEKLIAAKRLSDVTALTAYDGALFRVMPLGGFVQGATYIIRQNGQKVNKATLFQMTPTGELVPDSSSANLQNGEEIKLEIDAPLLATSSDQFTIELQSEPKRQFLSVPMGGSCSIRMPATVQTLRYTIPPQYEAYRASLVYFTERKYLPADAQLKSTEENQFRRWSYQRSMCSQIPFGGSEVGLGQELVAGACSDNGQPVASSVVRGRLGLLEMGDQLALTPEVTVDFNKTKNGACNVVSAFLLALREHDTEAITDHTCTLASSSTQIDATQIIPILHAVENLMQSEQDTTRKCAIGSAVELYGRIRDMRPQANENRALSLQIDQSQNPPVPHAEAKDVARILKGIQANIADKNTDVRASAIYYFQSLLELVWFRSGNNNLSEKETEKEQIAPIALEIIQTMLQKSEGLRASTAEAFRAIRILGPRAISLLPQLLALSGEKAISIGSLDSTLASVAPKDPRVFEAIANMLKSGREWDAPKTLVEIGQDKKPQVLNILLSAIKSDDYINGPITEALSAMGKDALSAKPQLYNIARTSKFARIREKALAAIVKIDSEDPEIIAEIIKAIKQPYQEEDQQEMPYNFQRYDHISLLGKIGKNAQAALPTLKTVMTTKLTRYERNALEDTFKKLQLPEAELAALLAALENTVLVN